MKQVQISKNDYFNNKINEVPREEVERQLIQFIQNIEKESGSKIIEDDKVFLSVRCADYIKQDFYYLSMREVETALKRGALGEYGEYFGINVKNIYSWLKKYTAQRRHIDFGNKNPQLSMQERMSFLVKNIDKLPSLKKFLSKHANNTVKA